jgi:hypothetical protein
MKEKKFEFWLPSKRLWKSGNADYAISFPARIMRGFGWEMNEKVELYISLDEIRIVRVKEEKKDKK